MLLGSQLGPQLGLLLVVLLQRPAREFTLISNVLGTVQFRLQGAAARFNFSQCLLLLCQGSRVGHGFGRLRPATQHATHLFAPIPQGEHFQHLQLVHHWRQGNDLFPSFDLLRHLDAFSHLPGHFAGFDGNVGHFGAFANQGSQFRPHGHGVDEHQCNIGSLTQHASQCAAHACAFIAGNLHSRQLCIGHGMVRLHHFT